MSNTLSEIEKPFAAIFGINLIGSMDENVIYWIMK